MLQMWVRFGGSSLNLRACRHQYNRRLLLSTSSKESQHLQHKEKDNETSNIVKELESIPEKRLSSIDENRREMKPFVKELFCGRFDDTILSYPDVLNNDRYFALEDRVKSLRDMLQDKSQLIQLIDPERHISKDILLALKSQGLYGLRGTEEQDGQHLGVTESMRIIEELASASLSLSTSLITASFMAKAVIDKHANVDLKREILPQINRGDAICAICMADDLSGCDASATNTLASLDNDLGDAGVHYISGKKTWVTNGPSADWFVVVANEYLQDDSQRMVTKPTAFLVDKNTQGVTVHKEEREHLRGLKGLETCSVSFDNVAVDHSRILGLPGDGFKAVNECLVGEARLANATQVLSALRRLLSATVRHTLGRRTFGAMLNSFDYVAHRLGQSGFHLFALESAIYMTAGIADYQHEQDISVEATACRLLAIRTARLITGHCRALLGRNTFQQDNHFANLFNDLEGLEWWEGTEDMCSLYIGLQGIIHTGKENEERLRKLMSPMANPFFVIMDGLRRVATKRGKPNLSLQLDQHVHPTLGPLADDVEVLVHRMALAVENLMCAHGFNAATKEMDMSRLSNVAVDIFAMSSAMARANRSYCEGHAHGQHEVNLTFAYVKTMLPQLNEALAETDRHDVNKNDQWYKTASLYMADKGFYSPVHPLTKNFF